MPETVAAGHHGRVAAPTRSRLLELHQRLKSVLERRSTALDELDTKTRAQLDGVTVQMTRLLAAAGARVHALDPNSAAAQRCVAAYLDELGQLFPTGFQPSDARPDDAQQFCPPGGCFLGVYIDDQVVGCGAVRALDTGVGEIKRMWIDPAWRGLGLARRLLAALESAATQLGHARIRLDTSEHLPAARGLYLSCGYREIPAYNANPYAHHWFERVLRADSPRAAATAPARNDG